MRFRTFVPVIAWNLLVCGSVAGGPMLRLWRGRRVARAELRAARLLSIGDRYRTVFGQRERSVKIK